MMYKSDRQKAMFNATLFVLSFVLVVMTVSTVWAFMYISRLQDRLETTGNAYRSARIELRKEKARGYKASEEIAALKARLLRVESALKSAENVASIPGSGERSNPVPKSEPVERPSIIYTNPRAGYGSTTFFRGECLSCYH